MLPATIVHHLHDEAGALQVRLESVRTFSETMPRVAAAEISNQALAAMEIFLSRAKAQLAVRISDYLRWLNADGNEASAQEARNRLTLLRLKFTSLLGQLDIFADALTQRSEHDHGVWLAGLDAVSKDALVLNGISLDLPPLLTYLDRGHGAAIRRVRTRLPGGGSNPVALIRVPRERMIGNGIAASLIHEVGHQGAALLDLVESVGRQLNVIISQADPSLQPTWRLWARWISEILADTWAMANLGVAATSGVMSVLCLPRAFIFRFKLDDPHPFPWIRTRLSIATGHYLFPDPQWRKLQRVWDSYYPLDGLSAEKQETIRLLLRTMQPFIRLLLNHRSKALKGRPLRAIFHLEQRTPGQLRSHYTEWLKSPHLMTAASPTLALGVLGQAKQDGLLGPERESQILQNLLRFWALAQTRKPSDPPRQAITK